MSDCEECADPSTCVATGMCDKVTRGSSSESICVCMWPSHLALKLTTAAGCGATPSTSSSVVSRTVAACTKGCSSFRSSSNARTKLTLKCRPSDATRTVWGRPSDATRTVWCPIPRLLHHCQAQTGTWV